MGCSTSTYVDAIVHVLHGVEGREKAHHDVAIACGGGASNARVYVRASAWDRSVAHSSAHIAIESLWHPRATDDSTHPAIL